MRVLAVLVVVSFVALPLLGCGVSASVEGCQTECQTCSSSSDCCHEIACSILTNDAQARCTNQSFACKLRP